MTPKRFYYLLAGLLGVLVIIGGAGYYLATTRVHAGIGNLRQKLAEQQIADDQIEQLKQLNKQYLKIQSQLPLIDAALPHDKQQTQIAIQLQQLASASGLSLSSVSFPSTTGPASSTSQTVKDTNALSLQLNFQSSGSYEQLQSFLQGIERLNRYSNVTTLSITRIQDKPKQLTFNIAMNVFVKP